jgi:hypothetical protein
MATNPELPPVDSPEEAKQFESESVKLHAYLDHILAEQPWSGWKRQKDPGEPYAFHEVVLPSYKMRYRGLKNTVTVPVRFESSSPYIIHDSEAGEAKLDLLVSENQVAKVGGLLRQPDINRQFKFLVEGRHYDYRYPERPPRPLTEEAIRYGILDESYNKWLPNVRQPSHRVTFDPSGQLIEASIAYNNEPFQSPIYASNLLRYTKDEGHLRTGLMAVRDINKLLEKAFPNPYKMTEIDNPTPEFDRSQYPELVACKIMPQMEEGISEVEVQDSEGSAIITKVPNEAVRKTEMPQLVQMMRELAAPEEVTHELGNYIAIGTLYCRVADRFDEQGLIRIEVPAVEGASSFVIDERSLGRRR